MDKNDTFTHAGGASSATVRQVERTGRADSNLTATKRISADDPLGALVPVSILTTQIGRSAAPDAVLCEVILNNHG